MNNKSFQEVLEELEKEKDIKNDRLPTTEAILNENQPREDRDTSKGSNDSDGRRNVKDTIMGVGRYGFALQGEEFKHRVWLSNERNRTQSRSTTRIRTSEERENTGRTRISTSEELSQSSKRLRTTIQGITRYGRESENAKIIDNDDIIKTKSNTINNNIYNLKKQTNMR